MNKVPIAISSSMDARLQDFYSPRYILHIYALSSDGQYKLKQYNKNFYYFVVKRSETPTGCSPAGLPDNHEAIDCHSLTGLRV